MSKQALDEFKARLTTDENLRAEISHSLGSARSEPSVDEIVAFAKTHGYAFTADEVSELNDEELDAVAGGVTLMQLCATGKHFPEAL